MKANAIDVFVCPACHGTLALTADARQGDEVMSGKVSCRRCGAAYPIEQGVPRFVGAGSYASSFGRQWNWFRTVQIDSANRRDESRTAFDEATGWTERDMTGRTVLDAGVGAGRFAEVAASKGARVFGVDLTNAVDAAFQNLGRHPNVYLAQADIFSLPFRPDTFDCAYSIGVLHHTPDPGDAFGHVAATVKPGGEFAVYVYAHYGPGWHAADAIRSVTTRLPPRLMLALSTVSIPLYYAYKLPGICKLARLVLPISMLPNWRWRWLDTFDWYTPRYQFKYLYPEVFRWFRDNGFRDVQIFDGPIRMRGMKAPADEARGTQHVA